MLTGFSPFAPRPSDIKPKAKPASLPLDCVRCGKWLVQASGIHRTADGLACWPLCEDA